MKAVVEYLLARTLNMGNFESTKIGVSLSLECDGSRQEVEKAFEKAKRFVERKVALEEHDWKVGDEES